MSWVEIPCERRRSPELAREHVQVSLSKGHVRIYIGASVLAELGWKIGDRVTVLRGEGENAGSLMLTKRERGGWKLQRHRATSTSGYLRLQAWPGVVDFDRRAVAVRHRVGLLKPFVNLPPSRGLEIELPAWGRPATNQRRAA